MPRILINVGLAVAGAGMLFTFAPYSVHWLLAFVLLLVLYRAVQHLTPRQGFVAGWCFGFGYFGLCVNWVYNSVYMFGAAGAPLAAAVTLLFILVMTLFPAVTVWAYLHLKKHIPWGARALLFASLWVLAELARGKIMGGFPWALVGYSQTSEGLGMLAPWIGVYGIGFLVVLIPAFLSDLVLAHKSKPVQAVMSIVVALILAAGMAYGAVLIGKIETSVAKNTSLNVRLVQANIPQELKFSTERLRNSLEQYTSLSVADLPETDLIIWPETAIPTYFSSVEDYIASFAEPLAAQGIQVLAGGFHREGDVSFNSIRQLADEKALYKKRHLVPFGEYMPFRFMLDWLAAYIDIPMSDLGQGAGPNEPMLLQGEHIGLSICYEDVFGEEMRAVIPEATVMVNVSNDAWFGEKVAPHQHQEKAQMRARELSRPLIRVTNTGVTSVMDHHGQITGSIPQGTQGYLDTTVVPRTGITLYARTGNWPVFIVAFLCLIASYFARRKAALYN